MMLTDIPGEQLETGRLRVAVTGEAVAVMGFHKRLFREGKEEDCLACPTIRIELDWGIR